MSSKESNDFVPKPPLGLTPEWVIKQERLDNVTDAMWRYIEARKVVPLGWYEEMNSLIGWLNENKKEREAAVKQPLFVTEDGVELTDRTHQVTAIEKGKYKLFEQYNGKSIATWLNGWYTTHWLMNPAEYPDQRVFDLIKEHFLIFSSKEKAEEYILMNRPILSVNDVLDLSRGKNAYTSMEKVFNKSIAATVIDNEAIIYLAKQKIKGE